jgi:hypothetical protein
MNEFFPGIRIVIEKKDCLHVQALALGRRLSYWSMGKMFRIKIPAYDRPQLACHFLPCSVMPRLTNPLKKKRQVIRLEDDTGFNDEQFDTPETPSKLHSIHHYTFSHT